MAGNKIIINSIENNLIGYLCKTKGGIICSIGSPIIFLEQFKDIPNELFNIAGLPRVEYEDKEKFSLNKLTTALLGFNIFQVIGITGLAFLASIVLVTMILPNLYFRIMLFTDKSTSASIIKRFKDIKRLDNIERRLSYSLKQYESI